MYPPFSIYSIPVLLRQIKPHLHAPGGGSPAKRVQHERIVISPVEVEVQVQTAADGVVDRGPDLEVVVPLRDGLLGVYFPLNGAGVTERELELERHVVFQLLPLTTRQEGRQAHVVLREAYRRCDVLVGQVGHLRVGEVQSHIATLVIFQSCRPPAFSLELNPNQRREPLLHLNRTHHKHWNITAVEGGAVCGRVTHHGQIHIQ